MPVPVKICSYGDGETGGAEQPRGQDQHRHQQLDQRKTLAGPTEPFHCPTRHRIRTRPAMLMLMRLEPASLASVMVARWLAVPLGLKAGLLVELITTSR